METACNPRSNYYSMVVAESKCLSGLRVNPVSEIAEMKKIALRGALQKLGCRDIELHWNGGVASRDQSGFFVGGGKNGFAEGQLYYITYHPLERSFAGGNVMYRTAQHRKDWTGGFNQWDFERRLAEIGYEMSMKAVMPKPRW